MTVPDGFWVGKEEHNGPPSMARPDAPESRWAWEAIVAVERPYNAVVSPDGTRVLYTLSQETSDIWVVPLSGGHPTRVTTNRPPMPYWEDGAAAWSPDGARIAYTSNGWVWVVPVAGGRPRKLIQARTPVWLDEDRLVVGVTRDEEDRIAVVRVDDPWPQPLTPAGQSCSSWTVAPEGSVLYLRHPKQDRKTTEIWRVRPGEEPTRLTGTPGMRDGWPRLSPDGDRLAFVSERSGWEEIHLLDLGDDAERRLTDDHADFSWLSWHSDGARILAVRTRMGRSDLVLIDAVDGAVTTLSPGGGWSKPSWAGEVVVAVHEDHVTPPRLVTIASGDRALTQLTAPPPAEIQASPRAPLRDVVFPSFDGLEIHGLLYRPPDRTGPAPAVVYPHGGPTSAYTDSWDPHAQYFVDKGYVWLAINYRGSTGYGRVFERANHGVWGVDDTRDCLAAYDYLVSTGWVDPDRVAIFGASYGSYMALCALAFDPEHRYACGVAKYGDSDIAISWATGDRVGREDLERMMGTPAESPREYRAGSPLWSVAEIERPLLVAHGEQDRRVGPEESQQLVDELRRLGKRFEYVTYPTEAHGLLRAGPELDFYRRLERFLDWHLM
ncbi:MAG: S9 family peptidase [Actinobacteria bacterium]|nr:S9 family peptidase [Actinomycetota bacterium]